LGKGKTMKTQGVDVLAFSKSNLDAAESKSMAAQQDVYKDAGVDTPEADAGLNHIKRRVEGTWPRQGKGRVVLPIGYFANVIEMDGAMANRSPPPAPEGSAP
jgi:hypothetical protein